MIRGISIISIILYHLSMTNFYNILLFPFVYGQFIGVATFFFLSGYALFEQYKIKGSNYLKGFLFKKIPRLYISYLLLFILYIIYDSCFNKGRNLSIITIAKNLVTFSFGNHILWYLCAQIIFYFIFYCIFIFNKIPNSPKIFLVFIFILLYSICCYKLGLSKTWYFNSIWFPIGMVISNNKEAIFCFVKRFLLLLVISTSTIVLLLFALLYLYGFNINGYNFYYIVQIILLLTGIPLITILSQYIKIKFLATIGKYSMELYITHNYLIMVIYDWKFANVFQFLIFVVLTILLSISIKFIVNRIYNTKMFKGEFSNGQKNS